LPFSFEAFNKPIDHIEAIVENLTIGDVTDVPGKQSVDDGEVNKQFINALLFRSF
jgi:hypothetical protein